jgi:predicted nucleic acid-binding protein
MKMATREEIEAGAAVVKRRQFVTDDMAEHIASGVLEAAERVRARARARVRYSGKRRRNDGLTAAEFVPRNMHSPADVDADSRSVARIIHGDEGTTDEGTVY